MVRHGANWVEPTAHVGRELVDEDRQADVAGTAVLDQRPCGRSLTARLAPVVDEEDTIAPVESGTLYA